MVLTLTFIRAEESASSSLSLKKGVMLQHVKEEKIKLLVFRFNSQYARQEDRGQKHTFQFLVCNLDLLYYYQI